MYLAKVKVTLRQSILDVQGKAVQHATHSLGYENVDNIRIGKYIEVLLKTDNEGDAQKEIQEICGKLLSNPVMEDFTFELQKVDA